ncbi:hypothetical protein, partial [Bartonella apis]|uniref:hypothetical protein n=1 Tax=Bartonella apis TaxID=1686310 RepID=UPI00242D0BAF
LNRREHILHTNLIYNQIRYLTSSLEKRAAIYSLKAQSFRELCRPRFSFFYLLLSKIERYSYRFKTNKLTAYPFSLKDLAHFLKSSLTANSSVLYKSATHCRQRRTALVVALI